MKALIKSGLCLAAGWLASGASAQDSGIKWQAAAAKNSSPVAVVSATGNAPDRKAAGARPITLSQPVPLDSLGTQAFRPPADPFAPIIRAQAADDKAPQPIPKLELGGAEPKAAQKIPQKMPKDAFTPPPPRPQSTPMPIFDSLGITHEGGLLGDCCDSVSSWFGRDICSTGCCLERPRFWASAEYLMWWQRGQNVPPLVTSSNPPFAPVLGSPTTNILFDGTPNSVRSGGRVGLGMWMCHFNNNLGIEMNYFFLGRQTTSAAFSGNGGVFIGRPFFDFTPAGGGVGVPPGTPSVERFSSVDSSGTATVNTYTQLWGIDGNLRYKWCCGPNYWIDILGGYRHLNMSEGIDITERLQLNAPPRLSVFEQESFHTRNQFNGGQVGVNSEVRFGNRFFFGTNAKVALGTVHQIVNINGSTTFSADGVAPITQPGALLASPTNIGRYTANRFAVLPEVTFKVGIDVTNNLRLFVGYDFLYLSNVVRPGDQIDLNVNQAYRPTPVGVGAGVAANSQPRLPAFNFRTTDYWAQGLNFGLQYRY